MPSLFEVPTFGAANKAAPINKNFGDTPADLLGVWKKKVINAVGPGFIRFESAGRFFSSNGSKPLNVAGNATSYTSIQFEGDSYDRIYGVGQNLWGMWKLNGDPNGREFIFKDNGFFGSIEPSGLVTMGVAKINLSAAQKKMRLAQLNAIMTSSPGNLLKMNGIYAPDSTFSYSIAGTELTLVDVATTISFVFDKVAGDAW